MSTRPTGKATTPTPAPPPSPSGNLPLPPPPPKPYATRATGTTVRPLCWIGSPKIFFTDALDATVCSTSRINSWTAIKVSCDLDAELLSPLVSECNLADRQASGKLLVLSFATSDGEQRDHADVFRNLERLFHLALDEAFHGSCVVAEHFRHPHHGSEGDHHVTIEPHCPIGGNTHRVTWLRTKCSSDDLLHFLVLLLRKAVLFRHLEHAIELLRTHRADVAAANDHSPCFFHFGLAEGGCAQLLSHL